MNIFLKSNRIFSAFAFLLLMSCISYAQIKTGGYKPVAVTDSGAIAAAEFAVGAQSDKDNAEVTLESIKTAEKQTVAGTNFRLCLEVAIAEADEDAAYTQLVKVVVFRNLKQEFSLTSWTEEECSEQE